jgi:hypothetical protein
MRADDLSAAFSLRHASAGTGLAITRSTTTDDGHSSSEAILQETD